MKNISLDQLQHTVQEFLLNPHQTDVGELTLETPNFSRHERLGIYHEAYRLRLIDALRNDYPAVEILLGKDTFIKLAGEYITHYPSHHPSLRWFGEKLAIFISANPNWCENIALYDLAKFEWAQAMAFDAADASSCALDDLRQLQPDQWMTLRLRFHPSLQVADTQTNAPQLWNAFIKDNTTINIESFPEKQHWIIWRDNLQVVYRSATFTEHICIDSFMNQHTFAEVCELLCEFLPAEQVPLHAAQCLQGWINSKIICEIIKS